MGNYDKYIVTTPRPEHLTHYRLPLDIRRSIAFMDSDVVDGACNMECVWYYKPFDGPPITPTTTPTRYSDFSEQTRTIPSRLAA